MTKSGQIKSKSDKSIKFFLDFADALWMKSKKWSSQLLHSALQFILSKAVNRQVRIVSHTCPNLPTKLRE